MKISNLLDKELKAMVMKMRTKLRERIGENSENFNKELDDMKKSRAEERSNWKEKYPAGSQEQTGWQRSVRKWPESKNSENKPKQQKEKDVKNKDTSRDTWNNIKCSNINITGVPERDGNEKRIENIFDKIMTEKFPNLEKETESKSKKRREPQTGGT